MDHCGLVVAGCESLGVAVGLCGLFWFVVSGCLHWYVHSYNPSQLQFIATRGNITLLMKSQSYLQLSILRTYIYRYMHKLFC